MAGSFFEFRKWREIQITSFLCRQGERKRPLDINSATHLLRHALGGVSGGEFAHFVHKISKLSFGGSP